MGVPATRSGILVAILGASVVLTPGVASAQRAPSTPLARPDGVTVVSDQPERPRSAAAILSPSEGTLVPPGPVARRNTLDAEAFPAPDLTPQVRNRRGVPWMVAGGGLFLAGAVVGDDGGTVLMLGGIGLGTYGAFVYFGR